MDQGECIKEALSEAVEASRKYQSGILTLDELEAAEENFEDVMLMHASPPGGDDPF